MEGLAIQHPVWSPDGRSIYFSSGTDLWRIQADGSNRERVREMRSAYALVMSPDGNSLYYTRLSTPFAFCRLDLQSGQETLISEGVASGSIAGSQKGVYFVGSDGQLHLRDWKTGDAKRIAVPSLASSLGITQWDTWFAVSPEGTELLWVRPSSQEIDLEMFKL